MSPSRPFILRPVATSLLMTGILLAGFVAYRQLPVSALPEVDYPTIQVLTFYPGASPEVMASSVTAPLERQFGQVPGLKQMTSLSSFGSSILVLQFDLNLNIDVAEQEVQAAINASGTYLPRDLPNPPIYSKSNPADAPVITLALTSDSMPLRQVEDYADTTLAQKISQLPGVGLVTIGGGQRPAVRIQANPTALASYGLSLEDLRTALGTANVNQAKGNLENRRQSFTIGANDQLMTPDQYASVIVAYRNGAAIRFSDVANVVDGAENDRQAAWMNTTPAVIVNIQRQPGANIIAVVDSIEHLLPQLRATLPQSINVRVLTDRTTTIRASVKDVQFSLMLTIGLVVLVIFLFLRSVSATVIPSIAVPLSIVGTFGVMYLLGYSLNNLTLMALTISTGFVVDDAIVMIENIARFIEMGDSPLQAALKGSEQIGFTIVSLTVSLIAVLIPLLFMGEIVGRLFREFAVTLAVTILVSAVVSLTLTPMMCGPAAAPHPGIAAGLVLPRIRALLRAHHLVVRHHPEFCPAISAHHAVHYRRHPGRHHPALHLRAQGLLPGAGYRRDPGDLRGQRRPSRSPPWPSGRRRLAAVILKDPDVAVALLLHRHRRDQRHHQQRPHPDQPEAARGAQRLGQRHHPAPRAPRQRRPGHHALHAARAGPDRRRPRLAHAIPVQPGRRERRRAFACGCPACWTSCVRGPSCATWPAIMQTGGLKETLVIDRDTASRFGITPQNIDDTLYDAFGQRLVSTIFTQLNQYHVVLEVDPRFQRTPADLDKIYVHANNDAQAPLSQVPLSQIAHFETTNTPLVITHQGQFPAVTVSFNLAPGVSLGDAVQVIRGAEQQIGFPASIQASFQGTAAGLPELAGQRAAPDPGRADHRLHRAGRAVRELHPPHHDSLDPAFGRRGRDPGAAA